MSSTCGIACSCFFSEVEVQRVLQSQQEHHAILRALRERNEVALEA